MRQAVADRQNAEFDKAFILALGTLGGGWTPWMKLSLIDSDYHRTVKAEPVATAYKVYRGEDRLTENSVYLRKMPDGTVKQGKNEEEMFGDLLHEQHPTRLLEIKGTLVPAPRYSLVWSALERYEPKSAEALAAARVVRERNKAERAEQRYAEETPLFAMIDRAEEQGKGR